LFCPNQSFFAIPDTMMRPYNPNVHSPGLKPLLPSHLEPSLRKGAPCVLSAKLDRGDRSYAYPTPGIQVFRAEADWHSDAFASITDSPDSEPVEARIDAERAAASDTQEARHSENTTNGKSAPWSEQTALEHGSDLDPGDGHSSAGHPPNLLNTDPSNSFSNLPPAEPERGLLPVLKNTNFLALWSGQVFSQLADKVYLVLMIALIASRFQTAGQTISGWVSSLMIAFTIPAVLFGSVAGVFVDHWRKRAVLVSTNLLRGGLVLGLPVLLWLTQGLAPFAGLPIGFLVVLVITFFVSTLTQFFAPAEQAVIPLIVERKHLLSANSLYTMTMMASVIVGFALGEPLLALADRVFQPIAASLHLGPALGKELLVGGSYTIAGLILMRLRTREKTDDTNESLPDVWQNIRDGLRYLNAQHRVRAAMIQLVILFSIFAALAVLAVRLAEIMPEIKSSQFGFLLAAGGMGMAIGSVLVGQFGQRFSRAQLGLYGSIGMASSLAAISFVAQHLWPTLPLLVLLGTCAAIVGVPMQTAIQEETPEAMRGKVFGLQNNAINVALSLPLALAGIAETIFGIQAVFLGLALLAVVGGALTGAISRTQPTEKTP
jgi:MFS family permease